MVSLAVDETMLVGLVVRYVAGEGLGGQVRMVSGKRVIIESQRGEVLAVERGIEVGLQAAGCADEGGLVVTPDPICHHHR